MNRTLTTARVVTAVSATLFGLANVSPGTAAYASPTGPTSSAAATVTRTIAGDLGRAVLPSLDDDCIIRTMCLTQWPYQYGPFTASWRWDVGPTPYWISIFNSTTNQRIAVCGYGDSCTSDGNYGPPPDTCYEYIAFIAGYGDSMPLDDVQSTSNTVQVCNRLG